MSASALVRSFDDLHFWMICDFIWASVLVKSHVAASFFSWVTKWSRLSSWSCVPSLKLNLSYSTWTFGEYNLLSAHKCHGRCLRQGLGQLMFESQCVRGALSCWFG